MPEWGTDSEDEDAVLSRLHLRCVNTSEIVVVQYGVDSWLEAGSGPSWVGGTTAAAPPPFRPSEPALCGSCPLVTPY